MLELVGTEQMVSESVAEVYGYISEGAFPTCEDLEMLITNTPFGVGFLLGYLLIVRKEVLFLLAMVDETELTVYYLFLNAAAQKLAFLKHSLVKIALHLIFRIAIQIDAKIIMALHFIGFRVSDWRVVVEVQRDFTRL